MVGTGASNNGSVEFPVNSGRQSSSGSGVKVGAPAGAGGAQRLPAGNVGPQTRGPKPPQPKQPKPRQPPQQTAPKFSANNPPMMTQPPPVPHPGLAPPYPDARSPQPTLMPNGLMVMPPPTGFIGAGMPPRVPKTFIPGMSGLLGR
jgi:hypothetical protein